MCIRTNRVPLYPISPVKQLDVPTPVIQEDTVDFPQSNVSGDTDAMEVNTEHMIREHTPPLLADLQPDFQGTTVFGVKLSLPFLFVISQENDHNTAFCTKTIHLLLLLDISKQFYRV